MVIYSVECWLIQCKCTHSFPEIIEPPQPVNISRDGKAVFNCTTVSDSISFNVNEEPMDENKLRNGFHLQDEVFDPSSNLRFRALVVDATPDKNGIVVQCVAFSSGYAPVVSLPVIMLVQGNLTSNMYVYMYGTIYMYVLLLLIGVPANSAGAGEASTFIGPLRQTDVFMSSLVFSSKYKNKFVCMVCL